VVDVATRNSRRRRSDSGKAKKSNGSVRYVRYASYIITLLIVFLIFYSQYHYAQMGCLSYSVLSTASMPLDCRLSVANGTIYLSLLFPSAVFSYMLFRRRSMHEIIGELGLSRSKLTLKSIGIGIILFLSILLLSIILSIFTTVTGIQLPTNVQQLLSGMPLYLLVFSFIVAPIDEEILFRGFFVPRIGIIGSAILFALLHSSYASISEFIAALIFGLLAGYVFKKTRSLYASITGHILVNMLTVLSILAIQGI